VTIWRRGKKKRNAAKGGGKKEWEEEHFLYSFALKGRKKRGSPPC